MPEQRADTKGQSEGETAGWDQVKRGGGEKKRFPSTSDWNYWKVVVVHIFFSDYRMTSGLAQIKDSFD